MGGLLSCPQTTPAAIGAHGRFFSTTTTFHPLQICCVRPLKMTTQPSLHRHYHSTSPNRSGAILLQPRPLHSSPTSSTPSNPNVPLQPIHGSCHATTPC